MSPHVLKVNQADNNTEYDVPRVRLENQACIQNRLVKL